MKNYASKSNPHGIKVGDLFQCSWGWDQTNVNHFQVTRTSDSGVWVREIGAASVPGTQGFMSENVKPIKDHFLARSQWCGGFDGGNPETFRRVNMFTSSYGGKDIKPVFNFKGRYFAYKVVGTGETYNSWYA
jgi:hypothetical protein